MKNVLVTGAAGFLGSYVVRHFAAEGWRVLGIDEILPQETPGGDVTFERLSLPNPALAARLKEFRPQVCVHCAGCASVGLSMENPARDFQGNVGLVLEMLEALRVSAPDCRFLLLSSAAVYGNPAKLPVTELHAVQPLSPYGYHKRQAELLCEEYTRVYKVPTAIVRIFSAYGPGLRKQVVWDICQKILRDGKLTLHGTGRESRDFIHAQDIARALSLLAANAPCGAEIYNLASGVETSIAQLACSLVTLLGAKLEPKFDGTETPGNPLCWRADISKIAGCGFSPAISFEEGLQDVAQWALADRRVQLSLSAP